MKNFAELEYQRPNLSKSINDLKNLINKLSEANNTNAALRAIDEINTIRINCNSQETIVYIRNSLNTQDVFYKAEREFFNENSPKLTEALRGYYRVLLKHNLKNELQNILGKQVFKLAEKIIKVTSPEILEDLAQENKLCSRYEELSSLARIDFDGKENTLPQMTKYLEATDRSTRKAAAHKITAFFAENQNEFDQIFDDLVKLRNKIAKKLGVKNFVHVGYDRMQRTDYGPSEVASFRAAIKKYALPLAIKLTNNQATKLNLEQIYNYDLNLYHLEGNPVPKGSHEEILKAASDMYAELSNDTKHLFNEMNSKGLFDIISRNGKAPGGYCTAISTHKIPFVFANFNGTTGDISVLTHEMGHALQAYLSFNLSNPDYWGTTSELAEIHSMSMELLTQRWMPLFFGSRANDFIASELIRSIRFFCYAAQIDHFQHIIYEQPELTPDERGKIWRKLDAEYRPYLVYDQDTYLESGRGWQQQRHVYLAPFYYIDYALAQVSAMEIYERSKKDFDSTWKDYLNLCKLGGSIAYPEVLKTCNLSSPFEEDTLATVLKF